MHACMCQNAETRSNSVPNTYIGSHKYIYTYIHTYIHTCTQALKEELQKLGLKCGGTLEQRAKRLFETKGKDSLSEMDPALIAGVSAAGAKNGISKEQLKKSKRELA